MKNFKTLFSALVLLLTVSFSANAGQTVVETADLGEDKAAGTVRIVVSLTDVFVSNDAAKNTDIGIILHQTDFTGWNDGIALCMIQLMSETGEIELKGYNASAWGTEIVKVERNKQIALWLSYDADADTHSLSYQLEGETATTELYSAYGNRALPRSAANDFSRFCTVAFNNNFTAEGCVTIDNSAKFVDTIEPYTFETSAAISQTQANNAIQVSPSIAQNEITILSELAISAVSVVSINGQEILSSSNSKIDVSSLNAGIYLVKATTIDGNITIKRFVKQ